MTSALHTTRHIVNLPYTRAELSALLTAARNPEIDYGRHYTVSACKIEVRSPQDQRFTDKIASSIIGAFYINRLTYAIQNIECAKGYCMEDMLQELSILE